METIVLLSGGQDSTTCLFWAKSKFGSGIRTVAFDYGQRHKVELDCAARVAKLAAVMSHTVLPIEALRVLGGAALTDDSVRVESEATAISGNAFAHAHGLPSTFVPGRNMLFLTLAAAYGARFGVYNLVTGVCQADSAGYPDCRAQFVSDAQLALTSALDEKVTIHAPLLHLDKARTFQLADDLHVLDLVLRETHTCYEGNHEQLHRWGYGCGLCPACNERQRGYDAYRGLARDARKNPA